MRGKRLIRRLLGKDEARRPARTIEEGLESARAAWNREMQPFRNPLGIIDIPGYPLLDSVHMEGCQFLPSRRSIIERMPVGAVAAEIGVQTGAFSRFILDTNRPSELRLVDMDLATYGIDAMFRDEIGRGIVTTHEGDSSTIIASFPDAHFDYMYIDADHAYEGVKRDIAAAKSKIKPGGYLLFNDYTFWSAAECMPYGVIHAVNELCIEDGWKLVYFAFGQMSYNDVAVQRIADLSQPGG